MIIYQSRMRCELFTTKKCCGLVEIPLEMSDLNLRMRTSFP